MGVSRGRKSCCVEANWFSFGAKVGRPGWTRLSSSSLMHIQSQDAESEIRCRFGFGVGQWRLAERSRWSGGADAQGMTPLTSQNVTPQEATAGMILYGNPVPLLLRKIEKGLDLHLGILPFLYGRSRVECGRREERQALVNNATVEEESPLEAESSQVQQRGKWNTPEYASL